MNDAQLVVALALLGGVLSLDVTAAFQVMLSQPIAAGGLAGLLAGDPLTGIAVGGVLQLVWIGVVPVGAAPFPDGAVSAAVGVGAAVFLERAGATSGVSVTAGLVAGLLVGVASQFLTGKVRRWNVRFADLAESGASRGDGRSVGRAVGLALLLRFISSTLLAGAALGLALLLRPASVIDIDGGFPAFLWAGAIAAGAILASRKGWWLACSLAGGFVVGLLVAGVA
jgi:mannose/fructose/N-acetylgalactosamine-specific phosphotransferase system component IIC